MTGDMTPPRRSSPRRAAARGRARSRSAGRASAVKRTRSREVQRRDRGHMTSPGERLSGVVGKPLPRASVAPWTSFIRPRQAARVVSASPASSSVAPRRARTPARPAASALGRPDRPRARLEPRRRDGRRRSSVPVPEPRRRRRDRRPEPLEHHRRDARPIVTRAFPRKPGRTSPDEVPRSIDARNQPGAGLKPGAATAASSVVAPAPSAHWQKVTAIASLRLKPVPPGP